MVVAALGLTHAALGGQVTARERAGWVGRAHVLLSVSFPVRVSTALWNADIDPSHR